MLKIHIISIYKRSDHISSKLKAQPEILLTQPWNVSICPHNARPAHKTETVTICDWFIKHSHTAGLTWGAMLYTIIHSSCTIKAQQSHPTYEQLCGNSHKSTSLPLAETSFLDMLGDTILDTNRMPERCGRHQPNRRRPFRKLDISTVGWQPLLSWPPPPGPTLHMESTSSHDTHQCLDLLF